MQFIPFRGRVFLLVMVLVLIIAGIIFMRVSGNNAAGTNNIETASPTIDLSKVVVKAVNADVYGKQETILTDKDGRTLYYSKQDVLHKVSCTADCTEAWAPLL